MTTIGKYRHLSRVATDAGHFVVMAIDHRTNLLEKLNQFAPKPLTDADFMAFKGAVIEAFAPHASAVLTDPAYGIAASVTKGIIGSDTGLLAPIEVTDYGLHPSLRTMQMIPDWSVEKIKLMGGDGVKLLLPYHPEAANAADKHAFVQAIIDDCTRFDIPFFLEPIPYALDPAGHLSSAERLAVTVAMCETFGTMGADILKLAFPVDHQQSQDESKWLAACEAVTAACSVPWALLSAGVDFDTFLRQSEIACKAGASGVIVGRAVWAEAVELQGTERAEFLAQVPAQRMQQLADICQRYAVPWSDKLPPPDTSINWYTQYAHQ